MTDTNQIRRWGFVLLQHRVGAMGLNASAQLMWLETARHPVGVPPGQQFIGGEVRGGMMFASVGLGLLVRTHAESPGHPLRLTASVGIGF